ncbi:Intermembrane phospholipid transport system binding protein MlaD [Vibrio stylophorae]|uniref:Intermembrane phospholipid transport system binding protein MlaD n=1 Tax=Vibrio stylophorae TaxID=659351 RepID=A0ABN8DN08_9VIBR|nr:outer membrane lipid asymmetry maintenance protein MlaD [Vibrio stylophorae]CAH0532506.1 Intermembrane phospholipid transport system binding protein MlaD [Vibrio stylophorae]
MQQTRKLELWVGLFVLAGIAALLVLVFNIANVKGLSQSESYQLTARFDNIGGLKVRSPVKIGGVVVGRISDIDLDVATHTPVVTMNIDSKYGYFSETTSASIYSAGLLGEQFVGLIPGFVDEEEGFDMLGDGDEIQDTKSALILEDLIGQVVYSLKGEDE